MHVNPKSRLVEIPNSSRGNYYFHCKLRHFTHEISCVVMRVHVFRNEVIIEWYCILQVRGYLSLLISLVAQFIDPLSLLYTDVEYVSITQYWLYV